VGIEREKERKKERELNRFFQENAIFYSIQGASLITLFFLKRNCFTVERDR
jgi:hypothetical protein